MQRYKSFVFQIFSSVWFHSSVPGSCRIVLSIAVLLLTCFTRPPEALSAEPLSLYVNNPPEIGEQDSLRLLIANLREEIRGHWINFPLDKPLYAKVRFTLMESGSVNRISMPIPSYSIPFDESCLRAVAASRSGKGFIYPLEIEAQFDNFIYYKYAAGLERAIPPTIPPSVQPPTGFPFSPSAFSPHSEPRRITLPGGRSRVRTLTILKNMSGRLLELDDGSIYEVDPVEQYKTGIWLEYSEVKVIDDSEMINEDDELVKVQRLK